MPAPESPELQHCANCGEALRGAFCHACGQRGTSLDVPLRRLVTEALGSVFSLDTRLLRTLVPLVWRPGFLTVEYIAGRRVPYVSPVTLYFFFSFVMFLVLNLSGYSVVANQGQPVDPGDELPAVAIYRTSEPSPEESSEGAESASEGVSSEEDSEPSSALGEFFLERLERAVTLNEEDPRAFNRTFRSHLARALILLVPVFALLLELLYRKNSGFYIRHLVMSLHLHAFSFLVLTIGGLLDLWRRDTAASDLLQLVLVGYFFLALRRVYGGTRLRTAVKLFVLLVSYVFVLTVSILATLLVTLSLAG